MDKEDLFKIRYRNIPVDKEEHIKKITFTLQNVKYDFDKNIINGQTMDLIDPKRGLQGIPETYPKRGLQGIPETYPIEPRGFRFGETDNDSQSLLILNKLFDGHIDGYIAPNFNSPFHIENSFKIQSEIVLLDPIKCNIKQINIVKSDTIQNTHIIDYMTKYNTVHFNLEGFTKPSLIMKGGFTNTNNIRNPNELFDSLSNKSYYELKTTIDNTVINMLNDKHVEYNIILPKSLKNKKDTKYRHMPKLTVSPWSSNSIPLQLSFE